MSMWRTKTEAATGLSGLSSVGTQQLDAYAASLNNWSCGGARLLE